MDRCKISVAAVVSEVEVRLSKLLTHCLKPIISDVLGTCGQSLPSFTSSLRSPAVIVSPCAWECWVTLQCLT